MCLKCITCYLEDTDWITAELVSLNSLKYKTHITKILSIYEKCMMLLEKKSKRECETGPLWIRIIIGTTEWHSYMEKSADLELRKSNIVCLINFKPQVVHYK